MASGDQSTTVILQRLLQRTIRREELQDMAKFKVGMDIRKHLNKLEEKFDELQLKNEEKLSYLLDSFEDEAKHELYSQTDYKANKKDLAWIWDKVKSIFYTKSPTLMN